MRVPRCTTIDFETREIVKGSHIPPEPVGVSIRLGNQSRKHYYAWGHEAGGNNCSKADGIRRVKEAWARKEPKLFFHAKFDMSVAVHWCECRPLKWDEFHDAMFLLFLYDPHAHDLKLKPAAERLLNLAPEEQDAVQQWLINHKVVTKRDKKWGRFIWKAPGDVVGPYANGDVDRTDGIFELLYVHVAERGMLPAYDRERKILPIFRENELTGLRVDTAALRRDIPVHQASMDKVDAWLRKRLKAPGLNIDADKDMGDALDSAGIITDWVLTPSGQRSVAKKNLRKSMYKDQQVFAMYGYRNRLATCLRMFEKNWLEEAENGDGHIHCNWNQVRQSKGFGDTSGGTRSGRPSTNDPNLLNLSKTWFDGVGALEYFHPSAIKLPDLPLVRTYILPDKYGRSEGVFLHRDFNQQEIRLLAHFEEDELYRQYQEDPWMDVHDLVRDLLADEGFPYERRKVKTLNFGLIYGKGRKLFADELEITEAEAGALMDAHSLVLPGVAGVFDTCEEITRGGDPIHTWGGREYHVEPAGYSPKFKRVMDYYYKLVNYLCQASAADVTKEVLIRYDEAKIDSRFLTTVYDEINISAPKGAAKREMKILRDAMESVEVDVPMLTDGKAGPNWGTLTKFNEPKFDIAAWRKRAEGWRQAA